MRPRAPSTTRRWPPPSRRCAARCAATSFLPAMPAPSSPFSSRTAIPCRRKPPRRGSLPSSPRRRRTPRRSAVASVPSWRPTMGARPRRSCNSRKRRSRCRANRTRPLSSSTDPRSSGPPPSRQSPCQEHASQVKERIRAVCRLHLPPNADRAAFIREKLNGYVRRLHLRLRIAGIRPAVIPALLARAASAVILSPGCRGTPAGSA